MATKKTHPSHPLHKHSPHRPARIREVLLTLVFGSLILIFLAITMINVTSNY